MFGEVPLAKGAALTLTEESLNPDDGNLAFGNDTISGEDPIRPGCRKAIAVSDAHTVDWAADG